MSTQSKMMIAMLAIGASAFAANAQDNILADKPAYTLGEAKTWTKVNGNGEEETYTFKTENLEKLTVTPANTSNIYLFPEEGGGWATPENQAIGIQGFYIDLGSSQSVGTVTTTWEGAAAQAYDIYLSDAVPTLDILSTTPVYSVSGLGQFQSNTAVLPDGSKGRYLVFQGTDATNWGWGVKIRSISATTPVKAELGSVSVNPQIVQLNEAVDLSIVAKDQLGVDINSSAYTVTVSDNATYSDGKLTVNSGTSTVVTVTMDGKSISNTIYVAVAPELPNAADIKTPIFTNTVVDDNATAGWVTAYNGGATNLGVFTFANGEVAQGFADARCVFFHNSVTTGDWNGNIDPVANGYRTLCLDIFGTENVEGSIEFEGVTGGEGVVATNPFTLEAGKWNHVVVNVAGASKLNNMSIRFNENNASTILLANIYFTPAYVAGDETAPVLGEVKATAAMTSVELELTATDDLSADVYYSIKVGDKTYSTSGASGATVNYTVSGLDSNTEYTITVTANDGKNVSEAKEVTVKTLGLPDAPQPDLTDLKVVNIFCPAINADAVPAFSNWGATSSMAVETSDNGQKVLAFNNYQWGGLDYLNLNVDGMTTLHIAIYSDLSGSIKIAPVWADANGAETPGKFLDVVGGQWNSYEIALKDFGYPDYGTTVGQLSMSDTNLGSFVVSNLYFSNKDISTSVAFETVEESDATVDVYTLQGICVARGIDVAEISNLPAGLYIAKGASKTTKVLVK